MMNRIFGELGTGTHGHRGAYKLLLCYFGENVGYRAIRYDLKCRDSTVIEIRRKVYNMLDVTGQKAMAEISIELEEHVLISVSGGINRGCQHTYLNSLPKENPMTALNGTRV
jgi:hypothetical protein